MAIEDETTGPRLIAVMWTMSGIALLFMTLRFFFKHRSGKKFYIDDILLATSWLSLVLCAVFITRAYHFGLGHHLSTLAHPNVVEAHRFLAVSYFFGTIGLLLCKTSFAVTLLRLAQERWQKAIIYVIIVTLNASLWVSAIFLFTSCSPLEKIFDPTLPGTCLDSMAILHYNRFASSYSAAMDFVLVLYPWYLLWGVNMRTVEKIGVCIAMSFGVLSGVVGIIKVTFMSGAVKWKDWTYNTDNRVWSTSETATVIIAASIPFLRTTRLIVKATQRSSEKGSSTPPEAWSEELQGSGSSTKGLTNWPRGDEERAETTNVGGSGPAEALHRSGGNVEKGRRGSSWVDD